MELIIGSRDKNELQALSHFLRRFQIIPISEQISDMAVDLLKQYRLSRGLLIAGRNDCRNSYCIKVSVAK
jgi:predicted nucleic acid-binding protein